MSVCLFIHKREIMASEMKHKVILAIFIVCILIPGNDSKKNSSILTLKIPDETESEDGFDNILYSFLDGDNTVLNQYLKIVSEIFRENLFGEKLRFLKDIRLKCLPKIYFRLKKLQHSDFINCQLLNSNIINVFGKRILDSCRKSDSIIECFIEVQHTLQKEIDAMEEDILEIYLNEIVGGKETCMGDILKQLKKFHDLVQRECK